MAPHGLRYTAEHEWVRADGDGVYTVGVTDYAASALGDVVYVSLPAGGGALSSGAVLGEVESTKSVSEVYAPLPGEVVECNDLLESQPDLINTDPYGDGWMVKIRSSDDAAFAGLMDAESYTSLTAG